MGVYLDDPYLATLRIALVSGLDKISTDKTASPVGDPSKNVVRDIYGLSMSLRCGPPTPEMSQYEIRDNLLTLITDVSKYATVPRDTADYPEETYLSLEKAFPLNPDCLSGLRFQKMLRVFIERIRSAEPRTKTETRIMFHRLLTTAWLLACVYMRHVVVDKKDQSHWDILRRRTDITYLLMRDLYSW